MSQCTTSGMIQATALPDWFRQEIPDPEALGRMQGLLREAGLHTVCESAHCPNLGQCFNRGTATFMILGDVCTRSCRFCAVKSGRPLIVDNAEPQKVANAVASLGLKFVVITSVTRDDLPDEGAEQFARTIQAVRDRSPQTKVEVLIPDLSAREELLRIVLDARPDVLAHNVETVERLSPKLRSLARHHRSLKTLSRAREIQPDILLKSSLMVGIGETDDEVFSTFDELRDAGCDIVTLGQYLAPSTGERHVPVERFVTPEAFERFRREGHHRGIRSVIAGPLVRSSYLAEQGYTSAMAVLNKTFS